VLGLGLVLNKDISYEVKPFVKWAGGKGQLLSTFRKFYPHMLSTGKINRYVEPFVGGGAVLFDMLHSFPVKEAVIIDINKDLINTYRVIRNKLDQLISLLTEMEHEYHALDIDAQKEKYYSVRETFNSSKIDTNLLDVEKAANFIFLNKTCFNGLYRVNMSGDFNVPAGNYRNPAICDTQNLTAASALLKNIEIVCADFKQSSSYVDSGAFVYFDPPYRPLNTTSSFTSYSPQSFTDEDQIALANLYRDLHETGALLMLSNSDPHNIDTNDDFFDNLYYGFNINRIQANRVINSKASKRGTVSEILVTNYKK